MNDKDVFPADAYHDPKDGMFKVPDPEPPSVDGENMVQFETGLWVPKPSLKWHSILWIHAGGGMFSFDCEESYDELRKIVAHANSTDADEWYHLTDPVYGHEVLVRGAMLRNVIGIVQGVKDIKKIASEQKQYEMQTRMAALESARRDVDTAASKLLLKNRKN